MKTPSASQARHVPWKPGGGDGARLREEARLVVGRPPPPRKLATSPGSPGEARLGLPPEGGHDVFGLFVGEVG